MIRVRLREAMENYQKASGARLTYERVASMTGMSKAAVESLANRVNYNPTLDVIDRLCQALQCSPGELLEMVSPNEALQGRVSD